MKHHYRRQILEHDLDAYGHVNNATYLTLFEEARWDLVTPKGCGFEHIQQSKKGPIILEVNIRYLRELKLRQWITIETELLDYQNKIGSVKQQILLEDNKVATEAIIKFGLFDLTTRKLIEPTPEWQNAFKT